MIQNSVLAADFAPGTTGTPVPATPAPGDAAGISAAYRALSLGGGHRLHRSRGHIRQAVVAAQV